MLHGELQRLLKRQRTLRVPAVQAVLAANPLRIHHVRRALVQVRKRLAAKVPRPVEVVLGARAVNGRPRVAVDEDHVVALAKPAILVLQHSLHHAHKVPAPFGLDKNVVARAIQILRVVGSLVPVVLPVAGCPLARRSLPVLRMEAPNVLGQLLQRHVVHGKVERVGLLRPVIGHGHLCGRRKRHFEVRIQRLHRRNRGQRALVGKVLAKSKAKKIPNRSLNRRRRLAIPPRPQHQVLQVHRVWRGDGEPQMRHHACALYVQNRGRRSRLHGNRIAVAARAVPAGRAPRLVILEARRRQQIAGLAAAHRLCRLGRRASAQQRRRAHACRHHAQQLPPPLIALHCHLCVAPLKPSFKPTCSRRYSRVSSKLRGLRHLGPCLLWSVRASLHTQ